MYTGDLEGGHKGPYPNSTRKKKHLTDFIFTAITKTNNSKEMILPPLKSVLNYAFVKFQHLRALLPPHCKFSQVTLTVQTLPESTRSQVSPQTLRRYDADSLLPDGINYNTKKWNKCKHSEYTDCKLSQNEVKIQKNVLNTCGFAN